MDPVSQGVVGASLPQAVENNRRYQRWAFTIGFLSGMAPDLDILIRSSQDPLLALDFHRHFTHSLIFIPVGALLCSLFFYPLFKSKLTFKRIYVYALLGYGTHALLDSCTSYGTRLFWPFSDLRVAWNNVSVIDPLFTIPMLSLVLFGYLKRKPVFARAALIYGLSYLALGLVARDQAEAIGMSLAQSRGHKVERITAKPSFGNIILWKVIYQSEGRYYIDAVKLGFEPEITHGESVKKLHIATDLPWLEAHRQSQQGIDLERFRVFSDDFLVLWPSRNNFVIDIRYSFLPNQVDPLWGIQMKPQQLDAHVDYVSTRSLNPQVRQDFFEMLF